jgi:hypothetical protein
MMAPSRGDRIILPDRTGTPGIGVGEAVVVVGHLVAVVAMQIALWCLARMLRCPLRASVIAAGLLLPHLVLAPWFARDRILLPTVIVERTFPGAPQGISDSRHAKLNDAVFQFVPWEAAVRDAIGAGRLPLWSDRIDGGSSVWANPQAQVLSPVKMLGRLVPIEDSLVTVMVLTMLVAFEGTWLAARLFGASQGGALLAACGFALGGGTMAWSILPNSSTVAWAPWLLAAVLRLVRRPQWRYVVAGAILTAFLVFSGHPETAAASGLLAVVCGLFLGRRNGGRLHGVVAAAAAAVLGAGLAAPLVLPFTHTMLKADRADEASVRPPPKGQVLWDAPSTWFVGELPRILLQPANPHAIGTPFVDPSPVPVPWPVAGSLYCGIAVFAGLAVALVRRRRRTLPLLVFAAVGCVLSVAPIPVERVLLGIPGIKVIVFNRVLPVAALCCCLVGGLGLSRLVGGGSGPREVLAAIGAAVAGILVAPSMAVAALWGLLFAAIVVARRRPAVGLILLTFAVLVDLVPWARDMLPVGRRELFFPPTAVTTELVGRTDHDGPWRVVATGTGYYPSSLSMYGLEDVRYHNPLAPQAYSRVLSAAFGFHDKREYFSRFRFRDHPLLDFLNVRVVAIRGSRRVPRGLHRLRSPGDGVQLGRNPGALRRFFIAPSAEIVPKDQVIASVAGLKDPRRVVIAAEDLGQWRVPERTWVPRAVRVEHLEPGSVDLALPKGGKKLLATSLTVPEGWHVTAAGQRLRTVTINGAFLGALVPAGADRVSLRFIPPGLSYGALLGAIAVGVLAVGTLVSARRRKYMHT